MCLAMIEKHVLGCIEYMRCRLLLRMFAVSVCQSVRQSVCLSRGLSRQRVQCVWGSFGAAFTKLLWPLVILTSVCVTVALQSCSSALHFLD